MRLGVGEPAAGPWQPVPAAEFAALVLAATGDPTGRPRIVAVDGRGAGGKTTVAAVLQSAVPRAAVVHTDDVAWHHSFFGWTDLLVQGVLLPLRAGRSVSYRPPAWQSRSRDGAIEVPAGLELVVVEGVGDEWMAEELPFLAEQRPWERADVVVAGTPPAGHPPGQVVVGT